MTANIRRLLPLVLLAAAWPALAAGSDVIGENLLWLAIIIIAARLFAPLAQRIGFPAVLGELEKIRTAGELVRRLGMRFNAGHALNYYNVEPIARLHGIRELHIGHSIVSRAVFVGLRAAVAEMKRLMRETAQQA